jgi:hypothetical protein
MTGIPQANTIIDFNLMMMDLAHSRSPYLNLLYFQARTVRKLRRLAARLIAVLCRPRAPVFSTACDNFPRSEPVWDGSLR